MKKVITVLSLFVLSAFTTKGDEWKPVSLADKVEVSMPGDAKDEMNGPQKGKKAVMMDSTEISGTVIDFAAFGLSEEQLTSMMETDMFKEQLKSGMTAQGGTIVAETSGRYNDKFFYYQFDIDAEKDGKKAKVLVRLVFYKGLGIALNIKGGKNGVEEKVRDQYFNSLKLAE